MPCTEAAPDCAVYRPRSPRASPLYRCVEDHAEELREAGHIHRRVEDETLERFLDCGDLHKGFARVHCDQCGHEYLLPFSCKTRCFCPSCHQKRTLIYGEWVEEEVLAAVPHRQYVFTVPKVLRGAFHQRHRLGELCRIVGRLLTEAYREADPDAQPGFILFVQTFGDLVTFHPHIHALVTDGVFDSDGVFRVLPPIPTELLEQQLRRAVVEMLLADEAIDEDLVAKLMSWQHSGFSVHNQVRIEAGDAQGRQQLACYMIRAPFSLEKTEYKAEPGVIVYRSKQHATLKRNFQIMPGAKWLEMLLQHVPDKGEHLVRYYGWYSNRARGKRKAEMADTEMAVLREGAPEHVDPEVSRAARAAWARLIKKVYEADPLVCPHCGGEMRFLAVIEAPLVIERILRHLGLWDPRPPSQGPPDDDDWPVNGQIPLTYEPLPAIA
jgi:hypothetical protein